MLVTAEESRDRAGLVSLRPVSACFSMRVSLGMAATRRIFVDRKEREGVSTSGVLELSLMGDAPCAVHLRDAMWISCRYELQMKSRRRLVFGFTSDIQLQRPGLALGLMYSSFGYI